MLWRNAAAALLGLAVVCVVFQDVFEVMLLPRRVQRQVRLVRIFYRSAWRFWTWLSPGGERGGSFLSNFGALSMVLLFAIWTSALVSGFGLMHWGLQGGGAEHDRSALSEQIYMSGVTFFTLGYGDVSPHSGASRFLAVAESGLGIGFVATVISYLPVIHQFFSRREAHVMQLDGRAGSPPTAATLLVRHAHPEDVALLNDFLREWEVWAAELLESHLSYPMLGYYRSQHENQSWLGALGCIMDATALVLVGAGGLRPLQARLTFSAGRQALVEIAQSFGVMPDRNSAGIRLDDADYDQLSGMLAEAGLHLPEGHGTRDTLTALRNTYEPLLEALCRYLEVAVPRWLPAETGTDNWTQGPRGLTASWLVDELSRRPGFLPADGEGSLARRLLRRKREG